MRPPTGPVVLEQEVIPETPVTNQVGFPEGFAALVTPATTAVKVIKSAKLAVVAFAVTETVGVTFATETVCPALRIVCI